MSHLPYQPIGEPWRIALGVFGGSGGRIDAGRDLRQEARMASGHPWIVSVRVANSSAPILSAYHFRATDIAGQWIAYAATKEIALEIVASAKAAGLHGRARNMTEAEAKMLLNRWQLRKAQTNRPTVRRTRNKRRRGLGRRGV